MQRAIGFWNNGESTETRLRSGSGNETLLDITITIGKRINHATK
jgi:hypothetical protein